MHKGIFPRGGLESDRIYSEEAAVSHEEEIRMDEQSSISNELMLCLP